ncbi:MAG: hybrid sensor histidine kinase/response regulator [Cyanobacteria bacterium J06635_1]
MPVSAEPRDAQPRDTQSIPNILVIDDEPDNYDVVETLLHREGYHLSYAASGQGALAQLDIFEPDVILLDVMMPELDGIEVCRRIKADPQWRAVPIVMVTALNTKADLARCLSTGADDFISKPVSGTELRARVQSMLRIKRHYDQVQSLLTLREDRVNMLAHDLRNPLAIILLAANLLQHPNLSPERKNQKVEEILRSGRRLNTQIDSMLMMAKLESGKFMLDLQPIRLRDLCQSVLEDFGAIAAPKKIQLVDHLCPDDVEFAADGKLLHRVLENLLSNAIKFAPEHSCIRLSAAPSDSDGVKIQVADNGPGVTETLRQSIFERYEIGTLQKNVAQIGLGLAFCKMAVEAHGGTIEVVDNYPTGAVFTVLLPSGLSNLNLWVGSTR